jgi:hypothetical protein
MALVFDILLDAVRDTLVLVPFLWGTYLVMEALECKAGERVYAAVRKAGPAGPLVGGVLGAVPQCGFSAVAATLWAGRVVTPGTLVAVLLSTSDELLPVFVAEGAPLGQLVAVLLTKVCVGVAVGFALDAALRLLRRGGDQHAHVNELCERAHCGCGHEHGAEEHDEHGGLSWGSVLLSATRHTLQVTVFIFVVTLAIDVLIELVGEQAVAGFMAGNPVASVFAAALVGLVPNCAASVVVTELFLDGTLGSAALLAGSLVSSGVGYLVLFRTNAHAGQNAAVVAFVYAVGVAAGLVMLASGLSF